MKNNLFLEKYPHVNIEHNGDGNLYYVEVVYQDKIFKEDIPIRFFELNPTSEEITTMIDNNINDFGEPKKVMVYWGKTKFYIPFWIWIAVLAIGLGCLYFFFGDLQISISLGGIITGSVILFIVYWLITSGDKYARGMPFDEAINPFLKPYDMYNDTFRKGMDFARKSDKTKNYKR